MLLCVTYNIYSGNGGKSRSISLSVYLDTQYSAKFIAWLVAQFEKDEQFFSKIRAKVHDERE